jgi:hypothetical protein
LPSFVFFSVGENPGMCADDSPPALYKAIPIAVN